MTRGAAVLAYDARCCFGIRCKVLFWHMMRGAVLVYGAQRCFGL